MLVMIGCAMVGVGGVEILMTLLYAHREADDNHAAYEVGIIQIQNSSMTYLQRFANKSTSVN